MTMNIFAIVRTIHVGVVAILCIVWCVGVGVGVCLCVCASVCFRDAYMRTLKQYVFVSECITAVAKMTDALVDLSLVVDGIPRQIQHSVSD